MLKRFARWLADYAEVMPTVDQTRIPMGGDAVARGSRWEAFYREEGGLADAIANLRREAFEAAQEAGANDDQTRLAWMLQDRAYRQLDSRICAIIATGNAVRKQAEIKQPLQVVKSV